jgi:hypothetical protein
MRVETGLAACQTGLFLLSKSASRRKTIESDGGLLPFFEKIMRHSKKIMRHSIGG